MNVNTNEVFETCHGKKWGIIDNFKCSKFKINKDEFNIFCYIYIQNVTVKKHEYILKKFNEFNLDNDVRKYL